MGKHEGGKIRLIARLRLLLRYDPETGYLWWRESGKRAGTKPTKTRLYRRVMVEGVEYLEQVVIWAMQTGEWPDREVDHRNHIKDDNRWDNLRLLTRAQNQRETRLYRNNSVGLRGVHPTRNPTRWGSSIRVNGVSKWLGTFGTPEEAHAAYMVAREKIC